MEEGQTPRECVLVSHRPKKDELRAVLRGSPTKVIEVIEINAYTKYKKSRVLYLEYITCESWQAKVCPWRRVRGVGRLFGFVTTPNEYYACI